jgi:hypothetical protein
MLTLRKEQLDALARQSRPAREESVRNCLEKETPDICNEMGDALFRALVSRGVIQAETYNIDKEADVVRFVRLMMTIDPAFDRMKKMAWAREILEEELLSGTEKLDLIYRELQGRAVDR